MESRVSYNGGKYGEGVEVWRIMSDTSFQLQFTDFENAAYACFICLMIHVIRSLLPNFYMPVSKVSLHFLTSFVSWPSPTHFRSMRTCIERINAMRLTLKSFGSVTTSRYDPFALLSNVLDRLQRWYSIRIHPRRIDERFLKFRRHYSSRAQIFGRKEGRNQEWNFFHFDEVFGFHWRKS